MALKWLRSIYRPLLWPNGPWWMKFRMSSVTLIMVLHKCSLEEALRKQASLDYSRLKVWHQGY